MRGVVEMARARVDRSQGRGHVGDHVVLDLAVRVDVGRAAGEGGAGKRFHGVAAFVDDAEGIDEFGQHVLLKFGREALASAGDAHHFTSQTFSGDEVGEIDRHGLSAGQDEKEAAAVVDGELRGLGHLVSFGICHVEGLGKSTSVQMAKPTGPCLDF